MPSRCTSLWYDALPTQQFLLRTRLHTSWLACVHQLFGIVDDDNGGELAEDAELVERARSLFSKVAKNKSVIEAGEHLTLSTLISFNQTLQRARVALPDSWQLTASSHSRCEDNTHTHTHSLTHSLTHTHTHTHTHPHTHTHTHTHFDSRGR
jgi:hypothetical protein